MSAPRHISQYANFIEPNYGPVDEVRADAIAKDVKDFSAALSEKYYGSVNADDYDVRVYVQAFLDDMFAQYIPSGGEPADGYMYASHMGEAVRSLEYGTNLFVEAMFSFKFCNDVKHQAFLVDAEKLFIRFSYSFVNAARAFYRKRNSAPN